MGGIIASTERTSLSLLIPCPMTCTKGWTPEDKIRHLVGCEPRQEPSLETKPCEKPDLTLSNLQKCEKYVSVDLGTWSVEFCYGGLNRLI